MLDVSKYLISKGWIEKRDGNSPSWCDPLNQRNFLHMRGALDVQLRRDSARLDAALEACRLALVILNEQAADEYGSLERFSYNPDLQVTVKRNREIRDAVRKVVEEEGDGK